MQNLQMNNFKEYIERTSELLKNISEADAFIKPSVEYWSAKEILGHLIDSASNNHKRFVTAALKDDLMFEGYAQNEWVTVQKHNESEWISLIKLWKQFNLHIANIINVIPAEIKLREVTKHNLHEIAWQTVPENEPTTLDYFMNDYIGHCEHHINQILKRAK